MRKVDYHTQVRAENEIQKVFFLQKINGLQKDRFRALALFPKYSTVTYKSYYKL